ncbi:MAG: pyridoxal phosphate-dependent decarboxylase family protein [Maritimibacter sp.]
MDHDGLNIWSKRAADWIRDYHAGLRDRPVRPDLVPGEFRAKIDAPLPMTPEPIERIFDDFAALVPDGLTHWQHPRFFAYFPANAAPISMLAEQLANAIASQAMLWQTAPAANEMEALVVDWMREALGVAADFTGTIHDSATTATLTAVLTMREKALSFQGITDGLAGAPRLRLYASSHTHSSIDKAARLSGIGQNNLVKVPTLGAEDGFSMDPKALDAAITADLQAGFLPVGVILAVGGTGVGAVDVPADLIPIAHKHGLPVHVDAAWAGSAMICEEFREMWRGVDAADSIVFNPHKWLGAQFDVSIQFLRDPAPQIRTMGLRPVYLETQGEDDVVNYNEWTVPMGRRFRALKLWFLLRAEGITGLQSRIRNHVTWAQEICEKIRALPGFEIVTEPRLSLFTFARTTDALTEDLLDRINRDGRIYLSQTQHNGKFVIRVQVGQFDCKREDVMMIETVLKDLT